MLSLGLCTLFLAVALLPRITATLHVRVAGVLLLGAAGLAVHALQPDAFSGALPVFGGYFAVGGIAQYLAAFVLLAGAVILLSVWAAPRAGQGTQAIAEYPLLVLFTSAGATFLLASADIISMYLAVELQSFAVYLLAAAYRGSESATAAGLKYFLLGALSSAMILLGVAIVYAQTGLTGLEFGLLGDALSPAVALGLLLVLAGLLFKVAAAPFHHWAPDVYDGAPTVVAAWLSVMPKISLLAFLLAALQNLPLDGALAPVGAVLGASAALSLLFGSTIGCAQTRIKRLLGYSAVNNVAYLLLALAAGTELGSAPFLFYLLQYSLVNLGAFLAVLAAGHIATGGRDLVSLSQLGVLLRSAPALALSFGIGLFSMAGVPPLAGFFAKYLVLEAAMASGLYWLSGLAILTSVVAAVYYIRVVALMAFWPQENSEGLAIQGEVASAQAYTLAAVGVLTVGFLIYPAFILNSLELLALSSAL
jgi:NADH-ubiquinone oxidoreductase chain 2